MVCARCGAVSDGNFCPRCGAPAASPSVPAAPTFGRACPRCGTVYLGNFCPRCGLPAATAPYTPGILRPPPSGARSALSILWTLAIGGVLFLMALNVVALLLSPGSVLPGIRGMSEGRLPDPSLANGIGNWTFMDVTGSGTSGMYNATGASPNGSLRTTLPSGTDVGGMWVQAFRVVGSTPFVAQLRLDVRVQSTGSGAAGARLIAAVDTVPQGLGPSNTSATVWMNGTTAWTTTPVLDLSAGVADPGTYYLKVAFIAATNPRPTTVDFANIRFAWATDAYFYVIGPIPLPTLLYYSVDPGIVEASYFFVAAAVLIPAAYYSLRERKLLARALTAPLGAIGIRLRSMSSWVAIAQTWLAANFFQMVVIFIVEALGAPVTTPVNITPANTWYYLYDLARASVFEELLFRALLIGVPMAVGAFIWQASEGKRRPNLRVVRYLWGGQLRKNSSSAALVVGGILVLLSSIIFGVQHYVGWGWWKTLPAAIMGLALGYVFVRHGIGAAILLHFLNDYLSSILLEGVGGLGMEVAFVLLFYSLVAAGAGFFVWYALDGWQHLQDFRGRNGARLIRQPVAAGTGPANLPPGGAGGNPPQGFAAYPPAAAPGSSPPPGYGPPWQAPWPGQPAGSAPPPAWPPPGVPSPRAAGRLPQGYAPTYHPAPYGYPPVRFQCPACGWVEAKYENRRFTCLRCGRTA